MVIISDVSLHGRIQYIDTLRLRLILTDRDRAYLAVWTGETTFHNFEPGSLCGKDVWFRVRQRVHEIEATIIMPMGGDAV